MTSKPYIIFKDTKFLLFLIILIAFFLRIEMLQGFSHSIYSGFLIWDERTLHEWAKKILFGESFNLPDMSPLPAYIMAGIYKLTSSDPQNVRIFNIIAGSLTCVPVYLIGKSLSGTKAGLFSALLTALYKPFIFYSVTIHKETFGIFIFAWLIFLLIKKYSYKSIIISGILLGLLVNIRQNTLVLLPVIPLLFLIEQKNLKQIFFSVLLYTAGFLAALLPFSATPLSGFNMYFSYNLENSLPYYRPVKFVSSVPFEQTPQFRIEASRRTGKNLSAKEASDYWKSEALKTIKSDPVYALSKVFSRTLAALNKYEEEDNFSISFLSKFISFLKIPLPNLWPVFPLGLAGLIFCCPHSKESRKLLLITISYFLTMLIFYFNIRIRIFLLAILIPCFVAGITKFLGSIKTKQKKLQIIYITLAAVFFLAGFLPGYKNHAVSSYYNTHAQVLFGKGHSRDALSYWQKSSELNDDYSAYADLILADYSMQKKDWNAALNYINKIDKDSFAISYGYEKMGDLMFQKGNLTDAAKFYEKALSVNSGLLKIYNKLIRIYTKTDSPKIIETKMALTNIKSFYNENLP